AGVGGDVRPKPVTIGVDCDPLQKPLLWRSADGERAIGTMPDCLGRSHALAPGPGGLLTTDGAEPLRLPAPPSLLEQDAAVLARAQASTHWSSPRSRRSSA